MREPPGPAGQDRAPHPIELDGAQPAVRSPGTSSPNIQAEAAFCAPENRVFVLLAAILASALGFMDGSVIALALPAIRAFAPDAIVVACGFDASGVDPLSRMLAGSDTFRAMTRAVMALSREVCGGRLLLVHEGGYSELHVPFCGHAVLEELSGSAITAQDPLAERIAAQQPGPRFEAFCAGLIDEMAEAAGLN